MAKRLRVVGEDQSVGAQDHAGAFTAAPVRGTPSIETTLGSRDATFDGVGLTGRHRALSAVEPAEVLVVDHGGAPTADEARGEGDRNEWVTPPPPRLVGVSGGDDGGSWVPLFNGAKPSGPWEGERVVLRSTWVR